MKILKVEEIKCGGCTSRIEKALDKEKIEATVTLENKTVKINEKDLKKTIEILDDLGFSAQEI